VQSGPVMMRANLASQSTEGPASASLVVAEIKGLEHPDQRVIIGGHLDSWDLAQGAVDDGTGAMATLEAARALSALGWKPKRTITFVLFTGEEEGNLGAALFLKNHASEVPQMDAVLIQDFGTGRVLNISLNDQWETQALMEEIYAPLRETFGLQPLSADYFGASDHVLFINHGIPGYVCTQAPAGYREEHHSQADTLDKVIPEQVNQSAAFMAAWAWNVSEMPQRLPQHPPVEQAGQ